MLEHHAFQVARLEESVRAYQKDVLAERIVAMKHCLQKQEQATSFSADFHMTQVSIYGHNRAQFDATAFCT
jgi:hypothetical protein